MEGKNCRQCKYFIAQYFLESTIFKTVGEKFCCSLSGLPQFIDNLDVCEKFYDIYEY